MTTTTPPRLRGNRAWRMFVLLPKTWVVVALHALRMEFVITSPRQGKYQKSTQRQDRATTAPAFRPRTRGCAGSWYIAPMTGPTERLALTAENLTPCAPDSNAHDPRGESEGGAQHGFSPAISPSRVSSKLRASDAAISASRSSEWFAS